MDHILDKQTWNALITGNNNLAKGNETVKYFDKEVSPFVALKDDSIEDFKMLYEELPHSGPVLLLSTSEIQIPNMWKVLNKIEGFQMVHEDKVQLPNTQAEIIPLRVEHVPQMLALTKQTNPGPFAPRTIEFGHYYGIFDGDKLVSMAGQRMHPFNYAEVSAVCTDPNYLGHGYARQLLLFHIHRIKAASEIPFLHVRFDNERAIKVYESLGFKIRKNVYFNVLQKQ